MTGADAQVRAADGGIEVRGLSTDHVGHLAFVAGIELHELTARRFDLEDLFFALTSGAPESGDGPAAPAGGERA